VTLIMMMFYPCQIGTARRRVLRINPLLQECAIFACVLDGSRRRRNEHYLDNHW